MKQVLKQIASVALLSSVALAVYAAPTVTFKFLNTPPSYNPVRADIKFKNDSNPQTIPTVTSDSANNLEPGKVAADIEGITVYSGYGLSQAYCRIDHMIDNLTFNVQWINGNAQCNQSD